MIILNILVNVFQNDTFSLMTLCISFYLFKSEKEGLRWFQQMAKWFTTPEMLGFHVYE